MKKHFDSSRRTSFSRPPSPNSNMTSAQASDQDRKLYGAGSSELDSATKHPWESSRVMEQEARFDFAFGDLASPLEHGPSGVARMV